MVGSAKASPFSSPTKYISCNDFFLFRLPGLMVINTTTSQSAQPTFMGVPATACADYGNNHCGRTSIGGKEGSSCYESNKTTQRPPLSEIRRPSTIDADRKRSISALLECLVGTVASSNNRPNLKLWKTTSKFFLQRNVEALIEIYLQLLSCDSTFLMVDSSTRVHCS